MSDRLTGGEAIVESLLAQGVDTVFGLPGAQTYALFDALQRAGERIAVLCPRHEQAAGYMAFGYAKSTGKVGVFTVVPGPGVLNAGAALCSAYGASTPVVCLTGEVPSTFIGSGMGHLHELPDQLATLRSITKWAERIDHPSEAPRLVAEAFRQARHGRPRPVALETPWDVFDSRAPVDPPEPLATCPPAAPDPDLIEQAAALLAHAVNPMIMVGGGAVDAADEILQLAERLQAPVVSFRSGRGVVSDEHYLGFTCAEGFERWNETDVLLGIGSRLELQWFRWPDQPERLKIVNIDVDPLQIARLRPEIGIVGDAKESVFSLLGALQSATSDVRSRRDEFLALKGGVAAAIARIAPHHEFLSVIRRVLPSDGFFVEELCQAGFASYYSFPVYQPRTFVTCGHQGTLGFGFPTSLGVKVGNPDKPVVSITGDGGFLFGLQELATAAQYGLGVVTVLFNNGAYGNVLRDQERRYGGRVLGARLENPDFVALGESFGVSSGRAETPAELQVALERALANGGPALIEVPIDPRDEVSPWEFLMPASRRTR